MAGMVPSIAYVRWHDDACNTAASYRRHRWSGIRPAFTHFHERLVCFGSQALSYVCDQIRAVGSAAAVIADSAAAGANSDAGSVVAANARVSAHAGSPQSCD
jgi:hypothetical protein